MPESDDAEFFADMRTLGQAAELASTTTDPLATELAEGVVGRIADAHRED